MTDDELRRDPEVARALEGIDVPEYEPGFWDRLGARLEHEGAPGRLAEVPQVLVAAPPVAAEVEPVELPVPVPLPAHASRRDRRRSAVALVAAAAAVLAIAAVQLGMRDPDGLQVAGEVEGGAQVAPDDGTTTPDASPERDGARRPGDDDDGPDTERGTDAGDTADAPSGAAEILLSPTSTVTGGVGGGSPSAASARLAPKSGPEAFVAWATAIDAGDLETAAALTGPRTIRYYEALGTSIEDVLAASGESWGVWADPEDRRIQAVELGEVDGERAVGLVLDRPAIDRDDADGRSYEGVPVVKGEGGWKVEPAAFDPSGDGRIEVVAPAPGPEGFAAMPKGGTIRVAAQRTGRYHLHLDLTQTTTVDASDAVDGEITWAPAALRTSTAPRHLLVVAHVADGQVTMLAQTFETAPA